MTLKRCLLLVDLQNEFLSPEGHFQIHASSRPFLQNIHIIVGAFRAAENPIIWVRSEYTTTSEINTPENYILTGTHTGQNECCEKGSLGAEFPEEFARDIAPDDTVLTKAWYSAFKETRLDELLKDRNINDIYVGGLLTNVCVLATVAEARGLGFNVTVLEDCLGWRKQASHQRGLDQMRDLGVQTLSSSSITGELIPAVVESQPQLPILYYVNGSIPSWRVMMALYAKNIPFEGQRLKVMSSPKETRLPAFLEINHRGKTPVFVDVILPTGTTININESLAILQYLETYYNADIPLLPPTSDRAAHALVLSRIQETENLHHVYDALEDAHFGAVSQPGGALDDADRAQLIHDVQNELEYWEVYASRTRFIAGDVFGLADCAFFPILGYMVHRGFEWQRYVPNADHGKGKANLGGLKNTGNHVDAWPNLKAYFDRVWSWGGPTGPAHKAQPAGWDREGKTNVWKGTKGGAKPVRTGSPNDSTPE